MRAIIFDTETTDQKDGEVIELAFCDVIFDPVQGELFRSAVSSFRYKPQRPISFGAMAVHHILPSDLDSCPAFTTNDLPAADVYIGHNVDFDRAFYPQCADAATIDTLVLSRKLWPDDSHTLGAMTYRLNPHYESARQALKNAHEAAADVVLTYQLLRGIYHTLHCPDLQAFIHASDEARVPSIMPFGKFKGQPISAVDNGWRAWYKKQSDQDPYLLEAFRLYPYGS